MNVKSSLHLTKTSRAHLILVSCIVLSGRCEDPYFDALRDQVTHHGLQVWLFQAGIWEDKTLIQVPIPEGEEGSLGCIGKSLIYFVGRICHYISVSHEDCGRLARSIEGVDHPSVQVIEWLL